MAIDFKRADEKDPIHTFLGIACVGSNTLLQQCNYKVKFRGSSDPCYVILNKLGNHRTIIDILLFLRSSNFSIVYQ